MNPSQNLSSHDVFVQVSSGRVENENTRLAGTLITVPLDVKITEWLAYSNSNLEWLTSMIIPLLTEGKIRLQVDDHYERVELLSHEPFEYVEAEQLLASYLANAGVDPSSLQESETENIPSSPSSTGQILPPDEIIVTSRSHGALLRAVTDGRLATLGVILEQEASIVNEPYGKGWTPLMIATWNGHLNTVKALITHKAQVDSRNEDGLSALMIAASKGHETIVQLLLSHGADAAGRDHNSKSVLMWAAQSGNVGIARKLLAYKAAMNVQNDKGMTALDYATREGHTEMIAQLRMAT